MQEFSFHVFEAFADGDGALSAHQPDRRARMRGLEKKVRVPGLIAASGAPQAGH
jgi:hypothetical protein